MSVLFLVVTQVCTEWLVLILELLEENDTLKVKVVPGITASLGAAAVMGAPLMNDFCHISLSDLMTPWEMIEKRLHAAAQGDFVVCLYNPRSKGRPEHLSRDGRQIHHPS